MTINKTTLSLLSLCLLALAVSFVFVPVPRTHAQNIGEGGRFPSDAGPAIFTYGTATDTTATTILTTARQGTGVFGYLYWAQCVSTSATPTAALIKSGSTTVTAVPCPPSAAYGQPYYFRPPLKLTTANTAATIQTAASITTAYFVTAVRTAR
jgi:hypothetical protein